MSVDRDTPQRDSDGDLLCEINFCRALLFIRRRVSVGLDNVQSPAFYRIAVFIIQHVVIGLIGSKFEVISAQGIEADCLFRERRHGCAEGAGRDSERVGAVSGKSERGGRAWAWGWGR